ncbi:MAG: low molecular weight protein-tyrosine-phosphatase [Burkholderiales bacterium]
MPVQPKKIRVLFVCLGNICRSPTAEGVFRQLVKEAGLANSVEVDSAGTGDYHLGERPDPRACWAASRRGYDLTPLRARQVTRGDFEQFDYVMAMDEQNLRALKQLAPEEHAHKLKMLTDFCSNGECGVPDPYAGGPQGFEFVLDLVEDAAQSLLRQIRTQTQV